MPPTEEVKRTIGRALGRVPSGVFIVTARHGARQVAMMASWVQQVAFEPPAISVAISREAGVDGEAFSAVNTTNTPGGVPILADALAWLECDLLQVVEFNADHDLYIARVTDGELLREGHSFTHVRGNGFHY